MVNLFHKIRFRTALIKRLPIKARFLLFTRYLMYLFQKVSGLPLILREDGIKLLCLTPETTKSAIYELAKTFHMDYFRMALRLVDSYGISTIFDIGANQGSFGLALAKAKGLEVFFVEPVDENLQNIMRNIAINGVHGCRLVPYAIADVRAKGIMIVRTLSDSRLLEPDKKFQREPTKEVNVITLEDLFLLTLRSTHRKQKILMKIDAQGSELRILSSASKLSLRRVSIIIVEVHKSLYNVPENRVIELMKERGFELLAKINYPFDGQPHLYFVSEKERYVSTLNDGAT